MLCFAKTREVKSPTRGTDGSAGIDLYTPEEIKIKPHGNVLIPSGIRFRIQKGYALVAFNKSSIAYKKGLIVGACVIDSDYSGEVFINLINTTNKEVIIEKDKKIIQLLEVAVPYSDIVEISNANLDMLHLNSERQDGCLGSTEK